jgi:hypothetical protein
MTVTSPTQKFPKKNGWFSNMIRLGSATVYGVHYVGSGCIILTTLPGPRRGARTHIMTPTRRRLIRRFRTATDIAAGFQGRSTRNGGDSWSRRGARPIRTTWADGRCIPEASGAVRTTRADGLGLAPSGTSDTVRPFKSFPWGSSAVPVRVCEGVWAYVCMCVCVVCVSARAHVSAGAGGG